MARTSLYSSQRRKTEAVKGTDPVGELQRMRGRDADLPPCAGQAAVTPRVSRLQIHGTMISTLDAVGSRVAAMTSSLYKYFCPAQHVVLDDSMLRRHTLQRLR